jgi:hypothetical protein
MSKNIKIKPMGVNEHSVFIDGKLVGEFRFIRDRVITTPHGRPGPRVTNIVTAGVLLDHTTNTRHDLGGFAWFKDVKRHVIAHFENVKTKFGDSRLPILGYGVGTDQFNKGDIVRLKPEVADGDKSMSRIALFYGDIEGGARLEAELNGFVSWNIADLEKVPA